MKVIKKTILSMVAINQNGDRNSAVDTQAHAIRLKAVTEAERQSLRISSYQYLLP